MHVKKRSSTTDQIPDKVYFRIGEVSTLVGVDTHVLRYWETEFKIIKPHRAKSKQRLYRRQDVENLLNIKYLLHEQGYTISGARKFLKGKDKVATKQKSADIRQQENSPESHLRIIKNELQDILKQLKPPSV